MTKCDFCEMSSPKGKCRYDSQFVREDYCKKAIERMVEALKANSDKYGVTAFDEEDEE